MPGKSVHVGPDDDRKPTSTYTLVDTILLVGHLVEHRIEQALNGLSLTARQYQALRHVADTPGLSRGALGRRLRLSPQGAGALARRLREAGLVDYVDAAPGQPVSFTITESGQVSLAEASSIVATTTRHILSLLPEMTGECLADATRTLTDRLEKSPM